jgi:hypothetical protein
MHPVTTDTTPSFTVAILFEPPLFRSVYLTKRRVALTAIFKGTQSAHKGKGGRIY